MAAWVEDVMARWVRILRAGGHESTPLDEGVRLVSEIGDEAGRSAWFRTPKGKAKDAGTGATLSRYVIAGLVSSDLLLDRLCAATGASREAVLEDLARDHGQWLRDEQLRVLRLEFAEACLRAASEPTYDQLGSRIEQIIRLAEQQVADLHKTTTSHPCPTCGAD